MKKQGIIFLFSLWDLFAFPNGYLNELIEDHKLRSAAWLQYPLGIITLAIVWGWYAPALGVAKALGIFNQLYELEIAVFPKNVVG